MDWYRLAEMFGTDPFGVGILTDKVKTPGYGNAGGDDHFGVFEPTYRSDSHGANDYFSESDEKPGIEKRLREKKRKKIIKKKRPVRKAQWGSDGPKMPHWEGKNWVTETYKDITETDSNNSGNNLTNDYDESISTIEDILNSTVTIKIVDGETEKTYGSGFFISNDLIMTCFHVVDLSHGNEKIIIKYNEKEDLATIIAGDQTEDIAVLRCNKLKSDKFLEIDQEKEIKRGEEIFVIGTPLGYENIVGEGIVSGREKSQDGYENNREFIFVSSNFSPGNSGGPVVRKRNKKVIGMAADIVTEETSKLNLAIPNDYLMEFIINKKINLGR